MKPRILSLFVIIMVALAIAVSFPANATGSADFHGLKPGEFTVLEHKVPVRIVMIGFEKDQVDKAALMSLLPGSYQPLVRFPQFYGLDGRNMGLDYLFDYEIIYKGDKFTNAFFDYLKKIGEPGDINFYQQLYNAQDNNVLEIEGPNLSIDATAVEKWLRNRDKGQGKRGYTIYFVNWYGRDDFHFHVFTKTDETDPDTKFNFGELDEGAMISWGGTYSRSWFYDFSAGPEWNTVNWLVDFDDLNGNGIGEYRMPPIWEYVAGGYRAPEDLGFDMGLLARFVAINLLFTTSALYDPLVTAPDAHGKKVAHITMFEDDPLSSGDDFLNPRHAKKEFRQFQPYYHWRVGSNNFDPIDPGSKTALEIFTQNPLQLGCWIPFGDPFAQLFCHYDANLSMYVPAYGERDYVAPIFAFNTTEAQLSFWFGLLGFADDNWTDGTQSYSFVFGGEEYRDIGYGFTSTVVHENGHHIGMSHPHDGYDSEFGFDYGPGDELWFAWVGDESDTVMGYLGISNGFGKHNADNMYRWETAGYLNWANAVAGDILDHPDSWRARFSLIGADISAKIALYAFKKWNYLVAVTFARLAYTTLDRAADRLGIATPTLAAARQSLPGSQQPTKHVCESRLMLELLERARQR